MSSLDVEGLSKIIQGGETEKLFGGGNGVASEAKIAREMQANGMEAAGASGAGGGANFSDVLTKSVEKVNEMQKQSDTAIAELVSGRTKNIHETMLTIERADTSLKLMMQVRNKILDAYKEIMHMQV
jgi:flagellar hook-basal body complex protein FliE